MAGIDTDRIASAIAEILAAIGEDPRRAGLVGTPARVAQSYAEYFAGIGVDPLDHLADSMSAEATAGELVLVRDIAFRSMCEHHLLPFRGVAHLAYLPAARLVGLGRLAQVVETLASRPQIQERLTEQIADALHDGLAPRGVLVVVDAVHDCVATRGPRQSHSSTVTLAARGSLADPAGRSEVVALIGAPRDGDAR